MEEVKKVLALFDSAEKWNAFIELSHMRNAMVDELKSRLLVELQIIAKTDLIDSGWELFSDNNSISMKPIETPLIAITIEWSWWNAPNTPWCRRGASIWIDGNSTNSNNVFDMIKSNKEGLIRHSSQKVARAVYYWFRKEQKNDQ